MITDRRAWFSRDIGQTTDSTTQNLRPPRLSPAPEANNDSEKHQISMVAWTSRVLIGVSIFFALQALFVAGPTHPRTLLFAFTIPVVALTPAWTRRVGAQRPAFVLCFLILIHVAGAQYLEGSFRPGSPAWFVVAAVLATMMAGPRVGIAITLAATALATGLFVAFSYGLPTTPDPGVIMSPSQSLLSLIAALSVVGGVVVRHERRRESAQTKLQEALDALRLANSELATARDHANAANEAKTQFVAGVSHELRTPLNGVTGMTDLLLRSNLQEEQREYAETIDRSTRSLVSLIDDLLDFSKLDIGKLKLDDGPFDVEEVLEESLALLATAAHKKGLELSASLEAGVPATVVGDAGRLRQVLLNLINNAIKFTSEGEVSVTGRLDARNGSNGTFRFEIRDTGRGIRPKDRDLIFDAFYQGDHGVNSELYGGTGLGLAISRRLVELMGGTISVYSTPGYGSRFDFTVQLGVFEPSSGDNLDVSQTLTGLRTLLVHWPTRPWSLACLHKQLARDGVFPVQSAGPHAVVQELAEAKPPYRLVIIDGAAPPEANELLSQINALPGRAPAVVVLRHPQSHGRPTDAQAGVVWLLRPSRRSTLLAGITRALASEAAAREGVITSENEAPRVGRILVAEDDETNQRTAQLMLEHLGYSVTIVNQGQDVLTILEERRFDLILMDGRMPGLTGYETAQTIRRRPGDDRHIPIVGMTAHAGPQERRRCLDAGMNDYLPKPVSIEALQSMLDKWVFARAPETTTTPSRARLATGVDLGVLESLVDLVKHPELVVELIDVFLRDAPETLKRIRAAEAEQNPAKLTDAAHKLKGAAGNLGAHGLAALSLRVETRARDGLLQGLTREVDALATELSIVQSVLQDKRQEMISRPVVQS